MQRLRGVRGLHLEDVTYLCDDDHPAERIQSKSCLTVPECVVSISLRGTMPPLNDPTTE